MTRKLKSKQIVPQEPFEQFPLPWEGSKYFIMRPRYMPELCDRELWICSLQDSRQQSKMIVLYEDEGRIPVNFFQNCFSKEFVRKSITFPIALTKSGTTERDVA